MLYNDSPQLNNPNLNFEIQILQHFYFYLLQIECLSLQIFGCFGWWFSFYKAYIYNIFNSLINIMLFFNVYWLYQFFKKSFSYYDKVLKFDLIILTIS